MNRIIIFFFVTLSIISCDDNFDEVKSESFSQDDSKDVILQSRDINISNILYKSIPKTRYAHAFLEPDEYLGYSYDYGNSITGDDENVRFPVINTKKLLARYPLYMTSKKIRKANSWSKSWDNYDSFSLDSTFVRTVSKGFEVNLKLFKIGRKKKTEQTFNYVITDESKSVLGETSAEIKHGMFNLQATSFVVNKIASEYLDESFVESLYNTPIMQFLDDYGYFVLNGYYTGGRVSALYYGIQKNDSDKEDKQKDMGLNLDASFNWNSKNGDLASGSLTFGTKINNYTNGEYINSLEKLFIKVKTIGGQYEYSMSPSVSEVNEVKFDFTKWLSSLDNDKNHVLIGIQDGGLQPISSYMLETNFKRRVQDTHLEYLRNKEFIEPYIEVVKVNSRTAINGESLYDVFAVLNTRNGDKIVLSDGLSESRSEKELRDNLNETIYLQKARNIANSKKPYFKIAMKANNTTRVQPLVHNPLVISFKAIDESRMYKFLNRNSNMWYVYDPNNLVAFSYYDDTYIPDCYGMSEWINTLQEKAISITTLSQRYTIIGL